MNTVLFEKIFWSKRREKKILRIIHGDLCTEKRDIDLVICSAYKNRYYPTGESVIGSLFWDKNISVDMLSCTPYIDMRDKGFWLSEEIDSNFKRIGCLELLEYGDDRSKNIAVTLKTKFSTMRYVLEQAAINKIRIAKVAIPLVGAGEEGIELSYIASVLYQQMELALEGIEEIEEINIYEKSAEKANEIKEIFESIQEETEAKQVFISYSSKQSQEAHRIKEAIEKKGYKCWIAPESIPSGKSYLEMIPVALNKVQVVVLLLTQEAEESVWVVKEIGVAVGKRKTVIPYRREMYQIGDTFGFMLADVQILTDEGNSDTYKDLLEEVEKKLAGSKKEENFFG